MIFYPTPIMEQIKFLYKICNAIMKKNASASPKIVAATPMRDRTIVQEHQEKKN